MQSQESKEIAAVLAHRLECGAGSGELAETIARTCRHIDAALAPVIGKRGVAALYQRSLHLAGRVHPCLDGAREEAPDAMNVAALASALAQQTSAEAAAAGTSLLLTFHGLLTGLIGKALAERLLRAVWATFLSSASTQGPTS